MKYLLIAWLAIASSAAAFSVNLKWDYDDLTINEFRIYAYRPTSSGTMYDNYITAIPSARTVTFDGLSSSHKYLFFCTALRDGVESLDSNKVPVNMPLATVTARPGGSIR